MILTMCIAGAIWALCVLVRRGLERRKPTRRDLAGGRVRVDLLYNQGSGFGFLPLKGRQMVPLSLAALGALLGMSG